MPNNKHGTQIRSSSAKLLRQPVLLVLGLRFVKLDTDARLYNLMAKTIISERLSGAGAEEEVEDEVNLANVEFAAFRATLVH